MIKTVRLSIFCLLIGLAGICLTLSASGTPTVSAEDQPNLAVEGSDEKKPDVSNFDRPTAESLDKALVTGWSRAEHAIRLGDLKTASDALQEVEKLKIELGYQMLRAYSLALIGESERYLRVGKREEAAYLTRKAVELSPGSAEVLLKSVRLGQLSGAFSGFSQLKKALKSVWSDRALVLKLFDAYLYPVLWALTLGLFLTFVLTFLHNFGSLLRAAGKVMPAGYRGFLTPVVLLVLLVAPCAAGPLWGTAAMALICAWCLPEKRWLVLATSILLCLWSSIIPLRENLHLRLADRGVQTILAASSGIYGPGDIDDLGQLVNLRPGDPVAWFTYAQSLRRKGEYRKAEYALNRAESIWQEKEPIIKAEKAVILFLNGESPQADSMFSQLRDNGDESAELLFNLSKVKFDLTDTEAARELYTAARRKNKELVDRLKSAEDILGLRDPRSIAEIKLPFKTVVGSVFMPMPGSHERHDELMFSMMPGLLPGAVLLVSIGLLAIFFLRGGKTLVRRRSALYSDYMIPGPMRFLTMLVPGGAWILAGKYALGFFLISTTVFLVFLVAGWPVEAGAIFASLPEFRVWGFSLLALYVLSLWYVGYFLPEEEA